MGGDPVVSELNTWQENCNLLYDFITIYSLEWPCVSLEFLGCNELGLGRYLLGTVTGSMDYNYIYVVEQVLTDVVSMEYRQYQRHSDYAGFQYSPFSPPSSVIDSPKSPQRASPHHKSPQFGVQTSANSENEGTNPRQNQQDKARKDRLAEQHRLLSDHKHGRKFRIVQKIEYPNTGDIHRVKSNKSRRLAAANTASGSLVVFKLQRDGWIEDDTDSPSLAEGKPPIVNYLAPTSRSMRSPNATSPMTKSPLTLSPVRADAGSASESSPQTENVPSSSGRMGSPESPDVLSPPVECPLAVIRGDGVAGWGLDWSRFNENQFVSSDDAGTICVWDSNRLDGPPVLKYEAAAPIQFVLASDQHPALFFTAGDNGEILIWDQRIGDPSEQSSKSRRPSGTGSSTTSSSRGCYRICKDSQSFNCLDSHFEYPYLLASGGTDVDVCLWDLRSSGSVYTGGWFSESSFPVSRLSGHKQMVNSVKFCPEYPHYLASSSSDSRCIIWDLRDIGQDQTAECANDGPAELLFSHGGHTAPVQSVDWMPRYCGMRNSDVCGSGFQTFLVTTDDLNQLHTWKFDHSIFFRDTTDPEDDDEADYMNDTFPVE